MHHRYYWIAAVALASVVIAPSADAQEMRPVHVIHGAAVTANGKPLARARLYLFGLTPSEYAGMTDGPPVVVTDDQGKFIWRVPAAAGLFAVPGQSGPNCYALPDDMRSWKAAAVLSSADSADFYTRSMMERVTRLCKTTWSANGAALSVVAPDMALVSLALRGPDGKPLANHKAEVVLADPWSYSGSFVHYGVTDARGRLQMRAYPGLLRMLIAAPGAGFGSTGYFEAHPSHAAAPAIPPLARFAQISGTVDASLIAPGATVQPGRYGLGEFQWRAPKVAADPTGRFTLRDTLPGRYYLSVSGGKGEALLREISVRPGEEILNARIESRASQPDPFVVVKPSSVPPSVSGHVADTAGRPMSDVQVYAVYAYFDGHGGAQKVFTAKTDAAGGFTIANLPSERNYDALTLYAVQPGRPLARTSTEAVAGSALPGERASRYQGDLVIPDSSGEMIVRVLHGSKPLPGALVQIRPQFAVSPFFSDNSTGDGAAALTALLAPSTKTNSQGEARFENLEPGLWNIAATGTDTAATGGYPKPLTGGAIGAAVGGARARFFSVNVGAAMPDTRLRVLGSNGVPPASSPISFDFELTSGLARSNTSLGLERNGKASLTLPQTGLWRVTTRFRDLPQDGLSNTTEPLYEGVTYCAVSPALFHYAPPDVRMVRKRSGRLRVRLRDSMGWPASGSAVVVGPTPNTRYAASIDSAGEAVFSDLPSGDYTIQTDWPRPQTPISLGAEGGPFPTDAALAETRMLMSRVVAVVSGKETVATMRPDQLGYVRGRLTGVDDLKNYRVLLPFFYPPNIESIHFDAHTGEFVAGPFARGKTTLLVRRITKDMENNAGADRYQTVDVTPGKVTQLILEPAPYPPPASPAPSLTEPLWRLDDRVFLPDGITPAWGARVAVYTPPAQNAIFAGRTDASGRITDRQEWMSFDTPTPVPPGSPTQPVVVAWLPGSYGASITPYTPGETKSLVLPAPVSIHGRVTAGKKSVKGLPSSFRIMAAYQGRGKLNAPLSFDVTAQADGSFDLAGLTPGMYRIQAARDGIWLSETQTITVGASPLPDLTLDIAPPGVVTIVHVRDAKGKPFIGKSIHVARPAGPLTDLLWPDTFPVDSAGDVRLEGLEAGPHQIGAGDGKGKSPLSKPFLVPAFEAGDPARDVTVLVPGKFAKEKI
ncbi:MAG: carboxypeptidase-like regulatory domain-containing protein [Capsulimonas sp.]|uniref:carboxypeptidase-like regulatory domain-containing protein n=1 Tax=Capsulimonas sp. TaxID=2494211 RepID=UPI003265ABD9